MYSDILLDNVGVEVYAEDVGLLEVYLKEI